MFKRSNATREARNGVVLWSHDPNDALGNALTYLLQGTRIGVTSLPFVEQRMERLIEYTLLPQGTRWTQLGQSLLEKLQNEKQRIEHRIEVAERAGNKPDPLDVARVEELKQELDTTDLANFYPIVTEKFFKDYAAARGLNEVLVAFIGALCEPRIEEQDWGYCVAQRITDDYVSVIYPDTPKLGVPDFAVVTKYEFPSMAQAFFTPLPDDPAVQSLANLLRKIDAFRITAALLPDPERGPGGTSARTKAYQTATMVSALISAFDRVGLGYVDSAIRLMAAPNAGARRVTAAAYRLHYRQTSLLDELENQVKTFEEIPVHPLVSYLASGWSSLVVDTVSGEHPAVLVSPSEYAKFVAMLPADRASAGRVPGICNVSSRLLVDIALRTITDPLVAAQLSDPACLVGSWGEWQLFRDTKAGLAAKWSALTLPSGNICSAADYVRLRSTFSTSTDPEDLSAGRTLGWSRLNADVGVVDGIFPPFIQTNGLKLDAPPAQAMFGFVPVIDLGDARAEPLVPHSMSDFAPDGTAWTTGLLRGRESVLHGARFQRRAIIGNMYMGEPDVYPAFPVDTPDMTDPEVSVIGAYFKNLNPRVFREPIVQRSINVPNTLNGVSGRSQWSAWWSIDVTDKVTALANRALVLSDKANADVTASVNNVPLLRRQGGALFYRRIALKSTPRPDAPDHTRSGVCTVDQLGQPTAPSGSPISLLMTLDGDLISAAPYSGFLMITVDGGSKREGLAYDWADLDSFIDVVGPPPSLNSARTTGDKLEPAGGLTTPME